MRLISLLNSGIVGRPATGLTPFLDQFAIGPPLSVDNVMKALESLTQQWRHVCEVLYIPRPVLNHIVDECSSDEERLRSGIRYWLLRDPYASWRRLITQLFQKNLYEVADTLVQKGYAEELSGQ